VLRLKPGTSRAAADAELQRLGPEIDRLQPPAAGMTITYGTGPLQQGLTDSLRQPLLMLWAAVAVVLLIACVNLAGLMFARGARRRREITTRLALGSGRTAIVRQLVVESALVASIGAGLGCILGVAVLQGLTGLAENALDLWQPIAMDARAVIAAVAVALVATVIFGLIPALHSTRMAQAPTSVGTRTVAGAASHLSRRAAVVVQVALGVTLLVGAGLLARSFTHLRGLEPGFDGRGAGDYFGTLRIPVGSGRVFDDRDAAGAPGVVIVNQTIVREYFGGADPIGRRIAIAGMQRQIIGVVGDVQLKPGFGQRGPLAPMPLAYIPLTQTNDAMLRLMHGWFSTALIVSRHERHDRAGASADGGPCRSAAAVR